MCWLAEDKAGERVVRPQANCNWRPRDGFKDSGYWADPPSCNERHMYFQRGGFTYGQIERELHPDDVNCGGHFGYGVFMREPIDLMHSFLNYNMQWINGQGRGVMNELRRRLQASDPQRCIMGQ